MRLYHYLIDIVNKRVWLSSPKCHTKLLYVREQVSLTIALITMMLRMFFRMPARPVFAAVSLFLTLSPAVPPISKFPFKSPVFMLIQTKEVFLSFCVGFVPWYLAVTRQRWACTNDPAGACDRPLSCARFAAESGRESCQEEEIRFHNFPSARCETFPFADLCLLPHLLVLLPPLCRP